MNEGRVRERARGRHVQAVPFSPRSVAGLLAGWEAAQLTELASGERVAVWRDLSGAGRDATQAEVNRRPTFRDAQVAGLPSVYFDGVDDALVGVSGLAARSPVTVVVVANVEGTSPHGRTISLGRFAVGQELGLGADATGTRLAVSGVGAGDPATGERATTASNRGWQVVSLVHVPGGRTELRRDGGDPLAWTVASDRTPVDIAGGAPDAPFALGAAVGGTLWPAAVSLAAALVYGRALDAIERGAIERWLGARYGVAVT